MKIKKAERVYEWSELGRGHTNLVPLLEMLGKDGMIILKPACLAGEEPYEKRALSIKYDKHFVIKKIAKLCCNILALSKDEWLQLQSEIWDFANEVKE